MGFPVVEDSGGVVTVAVGLPNVVVPSAAAAAPSGRGKGDVVERVAAVVVVLVVVEDCVVVPLGSIRPEYTLLFISI
jgi:hypothetical protein